jgi:putative transposase
MENLVLRQQLAVLKRRHPRPMLNVFDKLFWVSVCRFWSGWKKALIVVMPETVVRWHRAGFRLYWRLISRVRKPIGTRQTPKEIRKLIFRMMAENTTWGAPRIHDELLMLGFDISERTISRWMKRAPRDPGPGKRWLAFLRNHRGAVAVPVYHTEKENRAVLRTDIILARDRNLSAFC